MLLNVATSKHFAIRTLDVVRMYGNATYNRQINVRYAQVHLTDPIRHRQINQINDVVAMIFK